MPEQTTPIDDPALEGHEDWKDGKSLDDNPYDEGHDFVSWKKWRKGWHAAEQDTALTAKSPGSGTAGSYSALSDEDLTIFHAAMTAMTQGIHACQSNLTDDEWERAEEIWNSLDDEVNSRAL